VAREVEHREPDWDRAVGAAQRSEQHNGIGRPSPDELCRARVLLDDLCHVQQAARQAECHEDERNDSCWVAQHSQSRQIIESQPFYTKKGILGAFETRDVTALEPCFQLLIFSLRRMKLLPSLVTASTNPTLTKKELWA